MSGHKRLQVRVCMCVHTYIHTYIHIYIYGPQRETETARARLYDVHA